MTFQLISDSNILVDVY